METPIARRVIRDEVHHETNPGIDFHCFVADNILHSVCNPCQTNPFTTRYSFANHYTFTDQYTSANRDADINSDPPSSGYIGERDLVIRRTR